MPTALDAVIPNPSLFLQERGSSLGEWPGGEKGGKLLKGVHRVETGAPERGRGVQMNRG
jgi:hypothetical protein